MAENFNIAGSDPFTGQVHGASSGVPASAAGEVRKMTKMEYLNRDAIIERAEQTPLVVSSAVVCHEPTANHYVKLTVRTREVGMALSYLFRDFDWDKKVLDHFSVENHGTPITLLYCCFNDARDAETSRDDVDVVNHSVVTECVGQAEYAKAFKASGKQEGTTKSSDGLIIVAAQYDGKHPNEEGLFEHVVKVAKSFGDLVKFDEPQFVRGTWECKAEYFKITDARRTLVEWNEVKSKNFEGWCIFAKEVPGVQTSPRRRVTFAPETPHHSHVKAINTGMMFQSPTGRTAWTIDENGNQVAIDAPRRIPRASVGLAGPTLPLGEAYAPQQFVPAHATPSYSPNGASINRAGSGEIQLMPSLMGSDRDATTVDPERIRSGQDIRTTVMIRNVPSDMDAAEFKLELDRTSRGKYDFNYLRFDFAKSTNVGYGFVNFPEPLDLADFADARAGQPWRPVRDRGSRHVRCVGLAYATTQGRECCVEKFRNSSVMQEAEGMRPKLWYTRQSAPTPEQIATEEPFPPANNIAKLQRSRDNAGTVGLYAPSTNKGRYGRGRNQRSQYDRGTPAQIQEEAALNHVTPNHGRVGEYDGNMAFANMPYTHGNFNVNNFNGYAAQDMPPVPVMYPGYGYAYNGQYANNAPMQLAVRNRGAGSGDSGRCYNGGAVQGSFGMTPSNDGPAQSPSRIIYPNGANTNGNAFVNGGNFNGNTSPNGGYPNGNTFPNSVYADGNGYCYENAIGNGHGHQSS